MPDLRPPDVEVLMGEYLPAAARVDRLTAELSEALAERNAVVAALARGLTQREVSDLTGLTVAMVRTACWADWMANRPPALQVSAPKLGSSAAKSKPEIGGEHR